MMMDKAKTFHRRIARLPSGSSISDDILAAHRITQGCFFSLPIWKLSDPIGWWVPHEGDAFWRNTRHHLSGWYHAPASATAQHWLPHTLSEFTVPRERHRTLWNLSAGDAHGFAELLRAVNRCVAEGGGSFRQLAAANRGTDGSSTIFPHHAEIPEAMSYLWSWLQTSPSHVLVKAVAGLLAISNIHPFRDGNGRTARWLFNAILSEGTSDEMPFYPLYEYFARDRGTSTLHLRTVEICGDWNPMTEYIIDVLAAMARCRLNEGRGD